MAENDADTPGIERKRPWNWCHKCRQQVDADDIFDGSEVDCPGCGRTFMCVAYVSYLRPKGEHTVWRLEPIK